MKYPEFVRSVLVELADSNVDDVQRFSIESGPCKQ